MKKGMKIFLGIFIPVIIIGAGISGILLHDIIKDWRLSKLDSPIVDFPVENVNTIHIIWGYGDQGGDFHNGIDFGCN